MTVLPDDGNHVTLINSPVATGPGPGRSVLTLLRTCRQINQEAMGLFYSSNRLRIGYRNGKPWAALVRFLDSLGEPRRKAITHLAVSISGTHTQIFAATIQTLQRECPSLSSIHVRLIDMDHARLIRVAKSAILYVDEIMSRRLPCPTHPASIEIVLPDNSYRMSKWANPRMQQQIRDFNSVLEICFQKRSQSSEGRVAFKSFSRTGMWYWSSELGWRVNRPDEV